MKQFAADTVGDMDQELASGGADPTATSMRFLDELLRQLAGRSGAGQVLVGELDSVAGCVDVQRYLQAGQPQPLTRYELRGTPCEGVFDCDLAVIAAGVAERFPDDLMLVRGGIEGYAGIRLSTGEEAARGILVLLFEQPIVDPDGVADLLERMAPRVTMELERLRYEQRLARSEQRYRSLVESAQDGVLVHRGFDLVYVNPAVARMVGYDSPSEVMALGSALALLPPEEQAKARERFEARSRSEPVERDYDMQVLHRDGHLLTVRALVSQVEWDGEPALQLAVTDVSARVEAEERAAQARRLESIGKLSGGIAHDFNNLLAVVLGNLELARAQNTHAEIQPMLEQASQAAERGAELTRRLLSFARRQPLEPVVVPLDVLLAETRSMLARTLRPDVELGIEDGAGVPVLADPTQLQAALLNLVNNAQDALPDGGRIRIRTRLWPWTQLRSRFPEMQPLDHVCIEVADDGVGMPAAVREQAFEPFFSTKEVARGSGLGLSMVHGFVRQSRGEIELDSEAGKGTRVRIYLPVASEAPVANDEQEEAKTVPGQGRILVVEDEPTVREVTVAMLRSFGYEVDAAADGAAARAAAEADPPDLLLSDVVLPGERGPAIAVDMLRRWPQLRVMFMSGYTDTDDFDDLPIAQPVRLLQKPFRRETLRRQVAEVLASGSVQA